MYKKLKVEVLRNLQSKKAAMYKRWNHFLISKESKGLDVEAEKIHRFWSTTHKKYGIRYPWYLDTLCACATNLGLMDNEKIEFLRNK